MQSLPVSLAVTRESKPAQGYGRCAPGMKSSVGCGCCPGRLGPAAPFLGSVSLSDICLVHVRAR